MKTAFHSIKLKQ